MKELQRKQKLKHLFYSWPSLIIMAFITFLLAKGALGILQKEYESGETLEDLVAETRELENRHIELETKVGRLKTEEGVLAEVRSKFNATQEGEFVAIIVEEEKAPTSTKQTTGEKLKRGWDRFKALWSE